MRGTLAARDRLRISPIAFESLRVGDVVAYDAGGKVVVHRIVGRDADGFRTQGDGNWSRDAAPLTADRLLGKVADRENRQGRFAVAGGFRGRWRGRALRAIFRCRRRGEAAWNVFARGLRATGWVAFFWRPRIWTARFASPEGSLTKFIHRGRTVASWLPEERRWQCRMPYDLLLSPPNR